MRGEVALLGFTFLVIVICVLIYDALATAFGWPKAG